jgi:DNA-binding transcriptional MocR family regulator
LREIAFFNRLGRELDLPRCPGYASCNPITDQRNPRAPDNRDQTRQRDGEHLAVGGLVLTSCHQQRRCQNEIGKTDRQQDSPEKPRSPHGYRLWFSTHDCQASFPGSAWERAAPRLCLVASPATHSPYARKEAEPPVRVFPGRAWEQGISGNSRHELIAVSSFANSATSVPVPGK